MLPHKMFLTAFKFGFGNFIWLYLLTRVLVLVDSNCYVFVLILYTTICKVPSLYVVGFTEICTQFHYFYTN